jgi:hypothetical protein
MKNSSILLIVSIFLAGSACESGPEASSGSRFWSRVSAGQEGQFAGRHFRQAQRDFQNDGLVADGRGRRHRRGDMNGPGLRDGGGRRGPGPKHGMRGEGRGTRGEGRGMRDGSGRHPMGQGRRVGPPAEAISACEDKIAGDACSFEIEGDTVQSVCKARRSGAGPLACRAGKHTHRRHDTPAK